MSVIFDPHFSWTQNMYVYTYIFERCNDTRTERINTGRVRTQTNDRKTLRNRSIKLPIHGSLKIIRFQPPQYYLVRRISGGRLSPDIIKTVRFIGRVFKRFLFLFRSPHRWNLLQAQPGASRLIFFFIPSSRVKCNLYQVES